MNETPITRPSTPGLLADALSHMTTLFESEIGLVRREISEKITQAVTSIGVLVAAAVLMLSALILLLQGVVELLVQSGMRPSSAYFLVGVAIAILGGIAVALALRGLSAAKLAPVRTITQLGKDAQVLKEQVK
ncbi:phage holin family protein [Lichenihabitans sp. PAMC28606]|uniref:phage holin family protein n=1 Tax=Lichenihabitans sp. PAMC28606 TaxID=2880932 RepID=UPI001D0BD6FF|nr:phage holin family protein [Lichenihabitans sp. PAMC28606]UDL93276.1 phage holin family protein [Lichenihabitans sp. PAMC28606]